MHRNPGGGSGGFNPVPSFNPVPRFGLHYVGRGNAGPTFRDQTYSRNSAHFTSNPVARAGGPIPQQPAFRGMRFGMDNMRGPVQRFDSPTGPRHSAVQLGTGPRHRFGAAPVTSNRGNEGQIKNSAEIGQGNQNTNRNVTLGSTGFNPAPRFTAPSSLQATSKEIKPETDNTKKPVVMRVFGMKKANPSTYNTVRPTHEIAGTSKGSSSAYENENVTDTRERQNIQSQVRTGSAGFNPIPGFSVDKQNMQQKQGVRSAGFNPVSGFTSQKQDKELRFDESARESRYATDMVIDEPIQSGSSTKGPGAKEPVPLLSLSFEKGPSQLSTVKTDHFRVAESRPTTEEQISPAKKRSYDEMQESDDEMEETESEPVFSSVGGFLAQLRTKSATSSSAKETSNMIENKASLLTGKFNPVPNQLMMNTKFSEANKKIEEIKRQKTEGKAPVFVKEGHKPEEPKSTGQNVTNTGQESKAQGPKGRVHKPIPDSNIGSQMLQSMGWVPGTGLGTEGEGITNPVATVTRPGRQGLGSEPGKKKKACSEETEKSLRIVQKLVKQFLGGQKSAVTVLMDYCRKKDKELVFREADVPGSDMFRIQVYIAKRYVGLGLGRKKKEAKFDAAKKAFTLIIRELYTEADRPLPAFFSTLLNPEETSKDNLQMKWLRKSKQKVKSNPIDEQTVTPEFERLVGLFCNDPNAMCVLLEFCQKSKLTASFNEAPAGPGRFGFQCNIAGKDYKVGTGMTKKSAKADAARAAFTSIILQIYGRSGKPLPAVLKAKINREEMTPEMLIKSITSENS